jgi:two-component system LytT family response regulator
MNEIRAIIADDEPLARRGIRQLLDPYPDLTIIAETKNGLETVAALRGLRPDLLFLDVQMPELDGFEVLREIGTRNMPPVIFVTAFDEFAVRAFEANALDYLVKPLQVARFAQTIERVRDRLRAAKAEDVSRRLTALLAARDREQARQRIVASTPAGDLIIDADEIDWIEADDYYAAVHARAGRHLIRESLAALEQRLDANRFVRTHRSAIVNIDRVREVRKEDDELSLVLRNGVRIPVSRRRRLRVSKLLRHLKG